MSNRVGRPKTRKPKEGVPMHITITIDGGIVVALDKEASRRSGGRGPAWTRTDVVRDVLIGWLETREQAR